VKNIELVELVGGALQEQFARAFENVLENLQNPNTPFKNAREINIKLKFTQSEQRDRAMCDITVTEKLAPQAPLGTAFSIGRDLKTGELYAEEYGGQLKLRMGNDTTEVDTETGEVVEASGKIIDIRKVMRG
jgi:hypothetical protein